MINVFVDDVREPPNDGEDWIIARSSKAAMQILECASMYGDIDTISLDHDLGGDDTIEPILTWLQQAAYHRDHLPRVIRGHSANPVGMQKINQVIEWINERR